MFQELSFQIWLEGRADWKMCGRSRNPWKMFSVSQRNYETFKNFQPVLSVPTKWNDIIQKNRFLWLLIGFIFKLKYQWEQYSKFFLRGVVNQWTKPSNVNESLQNPCILIMTGLKKIKLNDHLSTWPRQCSTLGWFNRIFIVSETQKNV